MAKFVLVHIIIVIYHTIPFTWAATLIHVNLHHFPNDLFVMKNSHCQQFMPNLCYIVYIDLFIMAFWFWFVDNYQ